MSAGKRKVFLFINKAQDQRALTVASVQFIGVYRTDKKVKPLCLSAYPPKHQWCAAAGIPKCQSACLHASRNVCQRQRGPLWALTGAAWQPSLMMAISHVYLLSLSAWSCLQGQLRGVPVPDNVWNTPGHYNIIGLLPEDNTYAKGSMYILEPASISVVLCVTGMPCLSCAGLQGIAPVAGAAASSMRIALHPALPSCS